VQDVPPGCSKGASQTSERDQTGFFNSLDFTIRRQIPASASENQWPETGDLMLL
jgi:hypothetical protein